MKSIYKCFTFLGILALLYSCASRKNIAYLQDVDAKNSNEITTSYEIKLQPDDLLSIIVSAENPEVTVPFNLPQIQANYSIENNQTGIKTYLIDKEGFIDFPVIGKINLAGLTRIEANKKIADLVATHIKNPSINLKILNYKVSVLGEVNRPGSFNVVSDRITLLEALSLSGDLTIYGKRSNVLIIRESNGKKSFNRIDLTNANFINSPFYYLNQNDILIVEPNKTKINSSNFGPNIAVTVSILSILTTIAVLIFRN
jgi:polysaccharide export outer membrane protein